MQFHEDSHVMLVYSSALFGVISVRCNFDAQSVHMMLIFELVDQANFKKHTHSSDLGQF